MKPIVGITAEITDDGNHFLRPVYAKTIIQAGGIPLLIPLVPEEHIGPLCDQIDALFLTGGEDIDPGYYGEEPDVILGKVSPDMDNMEYKLVRKMLELDKPYIGVCRGLHMLNVVAGGSLYQSIHTQREEKSILHKQIAKRTHRSHHIKVDEDSRMYQMLQESEFKVNSFHHQGVNEVKEPLRIVAKASDGIIEGVESTEHTFVYGFQWHPEEFAIDGDEPSKRIFNAYIAAARKRKKDGQANR